MSRLISILVLLTLPLLVAAQAKKGKHSASSIRYETYLEMITAHELNAQLHFIASDFFLGRKAGSAGERAVAAYLASSYKGMGIPPPNGKVGDPLESYFQKFTFGNGPDGVTSQNVLAFVEGGDPALKNETIVLVAHYDHLGTGGAAVDTIFNGAADDGSGTVALLEIAESFAEAKRNGHGTKRSLLFLHTGAEESGLHGSMLYVSNPVIPLDRIYAVVNLDGVGGTDKPGASNAGNYVYLLFNDSTAHPLAELTRNTNAATGIGLDILTPENPQRYNSDNKPFEYELVPSVYFSSGLVEHYHKVSDEPSTIDYTHMEKIVRLIFGVAWEAADRSLSDPSVARRSFAKTGAYFCIPCGCASDKKEFQAPGVCPECRMALQPVWRRLGK